MKSLINYLLIFTILSNTLFSCEEENEADEMDIQFKTEQGYTHTDQTLESGTELVIGIEALTKKAGDPVIRFNISESVNDGEATSVYSESINTTTYDYDYDFTLGNEVGTHTFIFTVTNRDGFNRQTSLTITVP